LYTLVSSHYHEKWRNFAVFRRGKGVAMAEEPLAEARRRRDLGLLDTDQEDFISLLIDGAYSVREAAELAGVPTRTAERWMASAHKVFRELERRARAKGKVLDALVQVIDDARSTPWVKMEASQQLTHLLGLSPERIAERDGRCRERRLERDRRADGPAGPYGPGGGDGAAGADDPSAEGAAAPP
jgi:hypothetical protein